MIFLPADTHVRKYTTRLTEQLSKQLLKEQVNVIAKASQPQPRSKNNIFLVSGSQQLLEWNYDYSSVLYAIDYETETRFRFDYSLGSYVRSVSHSSGAEKARRLACVGSSRIGLYTCLSKKVS